MKHAAHTQAAVPCEGIKCCMLTALWPSLPFRLLNIRYIIVCSSESQEVWLAGRGFCQLFHMAMVRAWNYAKMAKPSFQLKPTATPNMQFHSIITSTPAILFINLSFDLLTLSPAVYSLTFYFVHTDNSDLMAFSWFGWNELKRTNTFPLNSRISFQLQNDGSSGP